MIKQKKFMRESEARSKHKGKKSLYHAEKLAADEAARRLALATGRSLEESAQLLLAGKPPLVPPPAAIWSEPRQWDADALERWTAEYSEQLRNPA
jgi:hypothetical protein